MDKSNEVAAAFADNYNIKSILNIKKNVFGSGDNYEITTDIFKVFLKIFPNSKKEDLSQEIETCQFLKTQGICCSNFIANKNGGFISVYDDSRIFHVQEYIEGIIWEKNTAPNWLMEEALSYLTRIHSVLQNQPLRLSRRFLNINNRQDSILHLQSLIDKATILNIPDRYEILYCLRYKKELLETCSINIPMDKLTYVKSHGDYTTCQIITVASSINGIVDFTETSLLPAIYEIMIFYIHSSRDCVDGSINAVNLKRIIEQYSRTIKLNKYDMLYIVELFILRQLQSNRIFANYIEHGENHYIEFDKSRVKINEYLYSNKDKITEFLQS